MDGSLLVIFLFLFCSVALPVSLLSSSSKKVQDHRRIQWEWLCQQFGVEGARNIWFRKLWLGAPECVVTMMYGKPQEMREHIHEKLGVKREYLYNRHSKPGKFDLRVTVKNGEVSSWSDTGM